MNFGHFCHIFWCNHKKISCIVHKNVSVYSVEFLCAKKQSILLLEVWHSLVIVNSEDLFSLPVFTYHLQATVRSPKKM